MESVTAIFLLLILIGVYFTPSIVALYRGKEPLAIFLLNFLLGWTFLGWVFALVWAATGPGVQRKRDNDDAPKFNYVGPPPKAPFTVHPPPE